MQQKKKTKRPNAHAKRRQKDPIIRVDFRVKNIIQCDQLGRASGKSKEKKSNNIFRYLRTSGHEERKGLESQFMRVRDLEHGGRLCHEVSVFLKRAS